MMLGEALTYAQDELKKSLITNPKLESELLLGHVVSLERIELYTRHLDILSEKDLQRFHELLQRKKNNEPTAYILEKKYFYKSEFVTKPGVLIPRPETEFIVELALEYLDEKPTNVFDFGCGTGCIGLSIILEKPNAHLFAADISETAIQISKTNANKLGVQNRATIMKSKIEDLKFDQQYDCIVANPPYISPDDENVETQVKKFEPHEALFCNDNGLEKIKSWSIKASELLKPEGVWIFEVGHKQAHDAVKFLEGLNSFKNFRIQKDLQGIDRVVVAVKR